MLNLKTTFNYLVITETLFPPYERERAKAIAKKLNPPIYGQIQSMLQVYGKELGSLREYYQQTFTSHDLSFIRQVNNLPTQDEKIIVREEQSRLPKIINDLCQESKNRDDISLIKGTCGTMLALAYYAASFNDEEVDNVASELLSNILEKLPKSDLSYSFSNGYAGIGWALTWLVSNGLLEDSIDEELQYIDSRIMELDFSRIKDLSFETGLGGMLAYINVRNFQSHIFNTQFLNEVFDACGQIENQPDLDIRTLIQCSLFKAIMSQSYSQGFLPLRIDDYITLPMLLPKDKQFQKTGLAGKAGFALFLTQQIKKTNNCKPFIKEEAR